jgi:DNA-binding MarR family transcriptional regulator
MSTVPDQDLTARAQQAWGVFQQSYLLTFRWFELATARFGLSHPQAAVLRVLRANGRPLPLSQIARFLSQEAQSTTELADRLERRGYVRRLRDPRDRRLVLLELTDQGREVIAQVLPALEEAGAEIFSALAPRELDAFISVLTTMRDKAGERLGIDPERLRLATSAETPSLR